MPITVYFNNDPSVGCTPRPAPLISISTSINKTGAGETFGVTYSMTLTGTILANRGSPFGASAITDVIFPDRNGVTPVGYGPYNLFYTGSNSAGNDAPEQVVDNNFALDSILSKQKAIRALFARDGQLMEITPVHGDQPAIVCNPRVISVNFSEGVYVDKCEYTIELEADTLRDRHGNIHNEGASQYLKNISSDVFVNTDETEYTTTANAAGTPQYFISDFSEDWSLDTDEAGSETDVNGYVKPRTYSISHNMSATGKTHYLPDGTKLRAWQQAKDFVQSRLYTINTAGDPIYNYPNSSNTTGGTTAINTIPSVIGGLIGQGTLDLIAAYGGYNRVVSEQIDEAGGTYSLTETWLLSKSTAYETYSISLSKSNDSSFLEVSIDGNIKGLSSMNPTGFGGTTTSTVTDTHPAGSHDKHIGTDAISAYTNAVARYNVVSNNGNFGINAEIYKRADIMITSASDTYLRLNPQALSESLGLNEAAGEVTYNVSFNNRPINVLTGVLYENITVNDTYPGDVFAVLPVIGRRTGPVLQYIGGRTEYKRDVSIEVLVSRVNTNEGISGHWGNPLYKTVDINTHANNAVTLLAQKPSLVNPTRTELQQLLMELSPVQEPGIRKYFLSPPTESWIPKEGRYTLNVSWVYELNT